MTTRQTLSRPSQIRILNVLRDADAPLSGQQIAKLACVSFWTVKNHAVPALTAAGLMHQSGWEKYAYGHKPTYSAGKGKTPPRPKSHLTMAERCREWREQSAKNQANKANRRLAKPDTITAALMGISN
jgi:hypothetical protein